MIDQVFPQSKERDDRNYKQEVHNQQIWENLMSAVQDDGSESVSYTHLTLPTKA